MLKSKKKLILYLKFIVGIFIRVITLSMSPVDDIFLSGSLDNTIRLWDLKSANCAVSIFFFNIFYNIFCFNLKGSDASKWSTSS